MFSKTQKTEKITTEEIEIISKSDFLNTELFFKEAKKIFINYEAELLQYSSLIDLQIFEKKYNVKLSEELKSYFRIIGGVYGYEFISVLNDLSTIQPINEYDWFSEKEEYQHLKYDKMFVLGDIMINSHQWVIKLNSTGKTESIIEMDSENEIASSISEFINKFVNDPYSVVG